MVSFKFFISCIFFIAGISGNELFGYDMSNIIGNEDAIHITVDSSGNDVSVNDFSIDTSFDELSDTSVLGRIKRFWNYTVNAFSWVVNVLRDGTTTTENFHRALMRFNDDLDTMISRDKIGKINFNPFIGMIRWVTGDLVFYEIYILFSMGITLVWIQVAMIVIEFIRNWTNAVWKLAPGIAEGKLFKWLFYRHI